MAKLSITKKKLLKEYNHEIDVICEDIDWKTSFSGEEICSIVHRILVKNKVKTSLSADKIYELYSNKVKSLCLTRTQWVETYGIPQIIGLIYEILENNN